MKQKLTKEEKQIAARTQEILIEMNADIQRNYRHIVATNEKYKDFDKKTQEEKDKYFAWEREYMKKQPNEGPCEYMERCKNCMTVEKDYIWNWETHAADLKTELKNKKRREKYNAKPKPTTKPTIKSKKQMLNKFINNHKN